IDMFHTSAAKSLNKTISNIGVDLMIDSVKNVKKGIFKTLTTPKAFINYGIALATNVVTNLVSALTT
ncbi:MAG: hypothetical protein IJX05_02215, partial [Clostridia bacterium]|nr:hypothetical protein [Clostridia bacterium]